MTDFVLNKALTLDALCGMAEKVGYFNPQNDNNETFTDGRSCDIFLCADTDALPTFHLWQNLMGDGKSYALKFNVDSLAYQIWEATNPDAISQFDELCKQEMRKEAKNEDDYYEILEMYCL